MTYYVKEQRRMATDFWSEAIRNTIFKVMEEKVSVNLEFYTKWKYLLKLRQNEDFFRQ